MNTEQRFNELETLLEFQDETIARLNDALVDQQQRLSALEQTTQLLIGRLKQLGDDGSSISNEIEPPPPHY